MKKLTPIFAIILIAIMMVVAVVSLKQESAIMDEIAHIPAGYSYLTQKDMRLNPEHPPLLKDLSAIPLLFMDINFPDQIESWTTKVNGQWDFGFNFLYESGNDADKIVFWSRLPMLLLLIAMGLIIYLWTKKLYGKYAALLATFLFSFSPTFIAHGRYVTTDVGAAFGFFIAIYFFVKWIKEPKRMNLIWAGIFFGIAQAIKFSLILLLPYFGLLILIWIFVQWKERKHDLLRSAVIYISKFLFIIIIGYLIIYPIYLFHTSNYPVEKQISDTKYIASNIPFKPSEKLLTYMVEKPLLRPYAQYTLGLFMVFQRATGGNTTFFLGDVTNKGWRHYFPVTYILKTPLVLQILTIIVLIYLALQIRRKKPKISKWLRMYFPEFAMLLFLAIYWASSITSNLNIGVRHILPTFPFVYILLSGQIKRMYDHLKKKKLFNVYKLIFAVLLIWYAVSSLSIFPYYLTYFTELVGGAKNGHIYVTDSNLDWGQDLKRLAKWTDENNIEKIHLDYFGGGDKKYYLGDKYEPWWGDRNPEDAKESYLAVSATLLKQGMAIPTKGWTKPTTYYEWLNQYEPITVIGNSIFVFYID